MNSSYQIWENEGTCSCHCLECCENASNIHCPASEYTSNYCCCENCQHLSNNGYDLRNREYFQEYEQESQYLHGNCNLQTRRNLPVENFSEQIHHCIYNNYGPCYDGNDHRNNSFANGRLNGHGQTYNTPPLSINNDEIIRASFDCEICGTKSKSYLKFDNTGNDSGTLTKDSFYSCATCASKQIELMYQNNKQGTSKSTITQGSAHTIGSQTSKRAPKRTILTKKNRKRAVNSGYFEFISPTHSPSRNTLKNTCTNLSKQEQCTSTHCATDDVRYGYFEVKEKSFANYDKIQSKRVLFPELDRIPTKISKEMDSNILRDSTMLDKCLSANFKQKVETLDKSLSADILTKEWMISLSEVLKILSRKAKQQLENSRRRRGLESISTKSLTQFKPSLISKTSVSKQISSIRNFRKKRSTTKSLSEGSIKVTKHSAQRIYSKKEKTEVRNDNVIGCKSYLDKALDKLENQISYKIEQALFTYADVSHKRDLAGTYYNENEEPVKMTPNKEAPVEINTEKTEMGTNTSETLQTLEDLIDSEEVEIDTNDFEERSSLSSHPCSHENKIYNSDASSHNTDKTSIGYILDNFENSQIIMNPVQSKAIHSNSTTNEINTRPEAKSIEEANFFAEGTECKLAIVSPSNHYKSGSSGKNSRTSHKNNRKKQNDLKLRDTKKSISKMKEDTCGGPSFCTCKRSSRQLNHDSPTFGEPVCGCGSVNEQAGVVIRKCTKVGTIIKNQPSAPKQNQVNVITKPTKPRKPPLKTIHEEPPQSLKIIPEDEDTQEAIELVKVEDSVKDLLIELENQIWSEDPQTSVPNEYNIEQISNVKNDSCCARQKCRDCPKKRYYAQILQSYNSKNIQKYNENQHGNQLYDYMMDVPLFNEDRQHKKSQYQLENKQIKLLNMISFIMFIVMFYGIFQCINIQTSKFPWF